MMNDMKNELERRFAARMETAGVAAALMEDDDTPKARRRIQRAKAAQFNDLVLDYNALLSRVTRGEKVIKRLVADVESFFNAQRTGDVTLQAEARKRLGDTLDDAYVFDGTGEEE